MTKIKICGLRTRNDVDIVNCYQPDYVGFVLAPSVRQVTPLEASCLNRELHNICSVAVVVDEPIETLVEMIRITNVDIIQLHGNENEDYIKELHKRTNIELWKAIRVQNYEDLNQLNMEGITTFLLDSFVKGSMGGTGKRFAWELLKEIDCSKLWIAGGINQENINEVLCLKPEGIDISSSVETNGYKDFEKVKNIISEVRQYE